MSSDSQATSSSFFKPVAEKYKAALPPEKLHLRMWVLENEFERFLKSFDDANISDRIGINMAVLKNLLTSYFYDIYRAKDFHGMELVNEDKKAAYLIQWINRHRPIYFKSDIEDLKLFDEKTMAKLLCLNEIFAVRVGLGYAQIRSSDVPNSLLHNLLYEIYYREATSGMLSQWFQTVRMSSGWKA